MSATPTVHFILADGTTHEITADVGSSVMQLAKRNQLPGILADCGGMCCCATCHVYIDDQWLDKLEEMQDEERDILDFAEEVNANSRLSCQIKVTDKLDGLVVHLPESQY